MAPPRTIRVGLLVCGTLGGAVGAVHGGYYEVYSHYWRTTTPANTNAQVIIDSYNIKKMEFPDEERISEYDLFMVTGSATNAYDDSIEWVRTLLSFLKGVIHDHPRVKLVGICFGHQIVCRALGGACAPNGGRWEIGPTCVHLTDMGHHVFGVDHLCLQEMHRDHVVLESFERQFASGELYLLGRTCLTGNQGVVKFYTPPESEADAEVHEKCHRDIQVLTLQGHPEFSESVVTGIVRQRPDMGTEVVCDYWEDKDGTGRRWEKTDGLDYVAKALWKMLGVTSESE
ncbi:Putative glutamine amidotransferase-like protein C13C5.04 [Leucoagaricus sp. SymC.cos]|nr:Putative glutamine amidotransferase-like protein C13C5.04 [Leucoagaricus sp. SymC.cos]